MKDAEADNKKEPHGEGADPTRSFDGSVVGPGSQIGPFRIEHELGRGGAGVVYLAHDTKLDRSVAIKSLPPEVKDNPKALSRFTREARVLASLNHPNIATIYEELEEAEGVSYLVLEYISGQTLAERIAKGPLKLDEALTIALQIAEAVAAAHEHDVIHRDLKPGNIKITEENKVKVLDFGLAKVVGGEVTDQQTTITEPGRVIGTPAYMSPEQARGRPTDKRADIWSFGCVLYEMLAGEVPFKGETISDTLAAILEHEPDWQALPESTPTNVVALLRRCLEKEPRRRLRDIGDIAIPLEDTTIELQRSTLRTGTAEAGRIKPKVWSRRALPWFITGVAVIILVFLGIIIGLKWAQPDENQSGELISMPIFKPINAIVVLPFENLSGDPEQEYFVDGMTDALSAELGKIKALRVISRTSAMHYKDTDKVIPEIAKELGVDAVIEGSVLKAGNDVRITAQLVDGRTDAHLWSDNYTGTLTNILALQSQVTLAIAREIEIALTPEEEVHITRTEPVNPDAYEAFLKGKFFFDKLTEESFKTAADYFNQAIELEPDYAEAYAWLSFACWAPSVYGYAARGESFTRAKMAANTAIELDETCGEAHVAVGWIALMYDWDWERAKLSLERAIDLNPNFSRGYQVLAWYFVVARRFDEAIDAMQTAVKLDPLSPPLNNHLANMYSYSGQVERAIEQREKTLALAPGFAEVMDDLAIDYLSMSMYAEAVASVEKGMSPAGRTSRLVCQLGRAYALSGRKDEAEILVQELQQRATSEYVFPVDFAWLYATLGNTDEAFRWLERAYQERHFSLWRLRMPSLWESLRSDPRFDDLVQRMNFPEAPDSGTAAKPSEATQEPIEKIAVLPFTSISSEAGEEWFVDGMTDALITQLGKIKALTVISRTSAMQYKNVSKPMREISRELGVDALIEGSVIRAGNDVQVTARLIDGRMDKRIWGDFFQGTFTNILALQSQVTLAIARQIEAALTPEEEARITRTEAVDPEAYAAFLKGKFFLDKFTKESLKIAADYFKQAIEIEPDYADAYALLAYAYWVPSVWGYSRPEESFPKARSAANKAMALDETLALAHGSVGWIALAYDWQWQKAKESFEKAYELNPNDPDAYRGLHWYFVVAGRLDEATEMIQTALKLDPLSQAYNNRVAWMYFNSGQVERAIEQRKKTLELDPGYVDAFYGLAEDYLRMSRYLEAIASVEKAMNLDGRTPGLVAMLGRAYALSGRKAQAETLLKELHKRAASEYVLPTFFAEVYASLGNKDEAFRWLEKGYQERNWFMLFLRIAPRWDPLRSDPRFDDLVQRMKYPE
jgi:TolB-like protein/Tfp pilus assembly protein PilF/predicted Ser/Thr protein kinase